MTTKVAEPQFFTIVRLTYQFQSILRAVKVKNKSSHESDAEHSFQLAMVTWYLGQNSNMDTIKLIKYSLVHDLVELYADDTDSFAATPNLINTKHKREMQSLNRLKKELTDFPELFSLIANYESRSDTEARFVYAIDKIIPFIDAYFYGQKDYYQENKVTFSAWKQKVLAKIKQVGGQDLVNISAIQESLNYFSTIKDFYYPEKATEFSETAAAGY